MQLSGNIQVPVLIKARLNVAKNPIFRILDPVGLLIQLVFVYYYIFKVTSDEILRLFRNNQPEKHHWILFTVFGTINT